MNFALQRFRGPLFMTLATASYLTNDTLMKLSTEGLPVYEALFLRSIWAIVWGIGLLALTRDLGKLGTTFHGRVLGRGAFELCGILCFIQALTHTPIADVTAIGQITPLIMMIAASVLFGEKLGWARIALISLGFFGALMVAQPSGEGISIYALAALANSVFCALRDIVARRIPHDTPALVVAFGTGIVVLVGSGIAHLLTEETVMPSLGVLALTAAAGLFLNGGHAAIFIAYRIGPTSTVAPFYYFFTLWALLSGLFVFGQFPNWLALAGIALVVGSGLAIVLADGRRLRPVPAD